MQEIAFVYRTFTQKEWDKMLNNLYGTRLVLSLFHQENTAVLNSLDVAFAIRTNLGDIFTRNPIILPDNAPPEIPRVIFQSEDGFTVSVSQSRTDFTYELKVETLYDQTLGQFVSVANKLTSAVLSGFGIGINRIAFILFSRLNLSGNGVQFIQDLYLNKDKLQDISGAETHWLVNPMLSGEAINRWVRVKSVANEQGVSENSVDVFIDTNTKVNPGRNYTLEEAGSFIENCYQDLRTNMYDILRFDWGEKHEQFRRLQ